MLNRWFYCATKTKNHHPINRRIKWLLKIELKKQNKRGPFQRMPNSLSSHASCSFQYPFLFLFTVFIPLEFNSFLLLETSSILQDSVQTFPFPHHTFPLDSWQPISYCPDMSLALLWDSWNHLLFYHAHLQMFQMLMNCFPSKTSSSLKAETIP